MSAAQFRAQRSGAAAAPGAMKQQVGLSSPAPGLRADGAVRALPVRPTAAAAATNAARVSAQAATAYVNRNAALRAPSPTPVALARPATYTSPAARLATRSNATAAALPSASALPASGGPSGSASAVSAASRPAATSSLLRRAPGAPVTATRAAVSSAAAVSPVLRTTSTGGSAAAPSAAAASSSVASSSLAARSKPAAGSMPRIASSGALAALATQSPAAASSFSSSALSGAQSSSLGVNSPNTRRRLTAAVSVSPASAQAVSAAMAAASAAPPSTQYSSTIALLERKYDEQFGPHSSAGPSSIPASAASSYSSSSTAPRPPSPFSAAYSATPPYMRTGASPAQLPSAAYAASSSSSSSAASSVRPPSAAASSSALWSCARCTYDNPARAMRCEMCEAPRGVPAGGMAAGAAAMQQRAALRQQQAQAASASSSSSSSAAYEQRGAQLASLARQNAASLSPTDSWEDLREAEEARRLTRTGAPPPQQALRAHERETASHALRRIQQSGRMGDDDDDDDDDVPALEDDPYARASVSRANLFPNTSASCSSNSTAAAHRRVTSLQRQIDAELSSIERDRSLAPAPASQRRFTVEDGGDSDDDAAWLQDDEDAAEASDNWDRPALTSLAPRTQQPYSYLSPSSSTSSLSSAALAPRQPQPYALSPPRANARVETSFSPLVSAAERLRREEEGGDEQQARRNNAAASLRREYLPASMQAASSSSSSAAGAPSAAAAAAAAAAAGAHAAAAAAQQQGVPVGSINVRLARADALRSEMLFLSSLFDNVRSYQSSLLGSLRQAGFVDDQQLAQVPGLHVGLVHYLIESAWAAAARSGQLGDNAGADPFSFAHSGPQLPAGHAERVAALPEKPLRAAVDNDCAICLDALPAGAVASAIPVCEHTFHAPCIKEWLGKNNTCPLCKRTALEPPKGQPQQPMQHQARGAPVRAE